MDSHEVKLLTNEEYLQQQAQLTAEFSLTRPNEYWQRKFELLDGFRDFCEVAATGPLTEEAKDTMFGFYQRRKLSNQFDWPAAPGIILKQRWQLYRARFDAMTLLPPDNTVVNRITAELTSYVSDFSAAPTPNNLFPRLDKKIILPLWRYFIYNSHRGPVGADAGGNFGWLIGFLNDNYKSLTEKQFYVFKQCFYILRGRNDGSGEPVAYSSLDSPEETAGDINVDLPEIDDTEAAEDENADEDTMPQDTRAATATAEAKPAQINPLLIGVGLVTALWIGASK